MPSITKSNLYGHHDFEGYLSFYGEPVVFARAINQAGFVYPVFSLTYDDPDGGAGVYTDVEEDMEIVVYDGATSVIKGRLRVAPGGATSTRIYVNEVSRGRIDFADNDRFEVLRSWRVRDRLVAANAAFDKDGRVTYSDQYANPAPWPNSGGGPWVGWLDDAGAITFDAATSVVLDPDSGGSMSYAWTFATGAETDPDPTVDYTGEAAGTDWVKLVVTDSGNSKSATKYIPIRLHDDDDPPLDVSMVSLEADRESGWRATFTMSAGEGALDAVPDGAMCSFWVKERINGVAGSYGNVNSSRSHIKFTGFLLRDSIRMDAESGELTFEAIGPMGILGLLPGFSQVFEYIASPANWQQMKGASIKRVLYAILRWGTTTERLFDLVFDGTDYAYPLLYVNAQTPFAQIKDLAEGIRCHFTCDRTGRMAFTMPLYWRDIGARAVTNTLTLTDDDLFELAITREHRTVYYMVEGRFTQAGTSGTSPAFYSRSPGAAPGEAPQSTTVERGITTSQTTANLETGLLEARLNGVYYGQPTPQGIDLQLPQSFAVLDPAYSEWLTLDAITTPRGQVLDDLRCVIESVTEDYSADAGTIDVRARVNAETYNPPGVTYVPPADPTVNIEFNLGLIEPFPIAPIDPLTGLTDPYPVALVAGLGSGTAKVYYASLFDPTTGTVNWALHDTNLTGDVIAMKADPFEPERWFIITTTGLWRNDNLPADAAWTQVIDTATLTGDVDRHLYYLDMPITRRGCILLTTGRNVVYRTFDYGANWTTSTMDGAVEQYFEAAEVMLSCHLCFSQQDSGVVWGGYLSGAGNNYSVVYIAVSTDWGATWTLKGTFTNSGTARTGPVVNVPYMKAPNAPNKAGASQMVYFCHGREWGGLTSRVGVTLNGGASWTTLSNDTFEPEYVGAISKYGLNTYTQDGRFLYYFMVDGSYQQLWATEDGLATQSLVFGLSFGAAALGVNGWPTNPYFLLTFTRGEGVKFTPDRRTIGLIDLNTGLANTDVVYCAGDLSVAT